ncbi:MAG: cell division protein ZapA [Deltaproteobacteria bacterium]|nr:cell division protein ZapA [Deltaproteobacteria bacterium]MCL5792945.1 cell division protein ZapA [Deltaproteobacteria bacterium]
MKKPYTINILGIELTVMSEDEPEYVEKVAKYVEEKIKSNMSSAAVSDTSILSVLTALNIADEFFKNEKEYKERIMYLETKIEELIKMIETKVSI